MRRRSFLKFLISVCGLFSINALAKNQTKESKLVADVLILSDDVYDFRRTYFAVALKYDKNNNVAPIVVAKELNIAAYEIIKIAKKNNIQVVKNHTLARTLYREVEVGKEIPESLYAAVAEILADVYKKLKE